VCINRRDPQKLGCAWLLPPCGPSGRSWLPRNMPSPLVLCCPIWSLYRSSGTSVIKIRWKKWPSLLAFQGHSKSSEPTRINRHLWLPISSIATIGLSRTVSAISVEYRKFFPPRVYLTPPMKGLPLELGIGARGQKN